MVGEPQSGSKVRAALNTEYDIMKLTKSKLKQLIKEELFKEQQEGNVVVDMTGRSYNVQELARYLDSEEIEVLLSRPEMYFVRVDRETNTPIGIGPE